MFKIDLTIFSIQFILLLISFWALNYTNSDRGNYTFASKATVIQAILGVILGIAIGVLVDVIIAILT